MIQKKDFVDFMRDPSGSIKTPEKAHWEDVPGYEVITILKEDNFDAFIQKHENVLVTFYGARTFQFIYFFQFASSLCILMEMVVIYLKIIGLEVFWMMLC